MDYTLAGNGFGIVVIALCEIATVALQHISDCSPPYHARSCQCVGPAAVPRSEITAGELSANHAANRRVLSSRDCAQPMVHDDRTSAIEYRRLAHHQLCFAAGISKSNLCGDCGTYRPTIELCKHEQAASMDPSVPRTFTVSISLLANSELCLQVSSHCVGTRRPAALSQRQIQHLVCSTDRKKLSNFETRMIAEVKLYWLIYQISSASPNGFSRADHRLVEWRDEHVQLFGMSYHCLLDICL